MQKQPTSFGSTNQDKFILGTVTLDLLLFSLLLSSAKFSSDTSQAVFALCFSLPSAIGYIVMRFVNEQNPVWTKLQWLSATFERFFFYFLPLIAYTACAAALYSSVHTSFPFASDILLIYSCFILLLIIIITGFLKKP